MQNEHLKLTNNSDIKCTVSCVAWVVHRCHCYFSVTDIENWPRGWTAHYCDVLGSVILHMWQIVNDSCFWAKFRCISKNVWTSIHKHWRFNICKRKKILTSTFLVLIYHITYKNFASQINKANVTPHLKKSQLNSMYSVFNLFVVYWHIVKNIFFTLWKIQFYQKIRSIDILCKALWIEQKYNNIYSNTSIATMTETTESR